jgi:L-threonylcarbamoyladenylate synthase
VEPLEADAERAVDALSAGAAVVLPTDTVYGLCANADSEEAVRRAYELKGREPLQPSALLAPDVDTLVDRIPELRSVAPMLRALLPGPLTLVVPNRARRYRWLAGSTPDAIGIRVPELSGAAAMVLARVGAVVATSANLPGGPDPRRVADIPPEIIDGCEAVLDAGDLPGTPSTIIDLTGEEPQVLREGAVPAADVLARLGSVTGAASGPG